ncbi:hypothetical protein F4779DRAFT_643183 [Xylariaceae sp. FL0662B]|nr:hypothetical protein F4779DRAFT_643183 [Xylariaceae sp. FL0662B]
MAENGEQADLPVLIIGAGCSGLALANGLRQHNIPCKVFERDAALTARNARDWGMACHWAAPALASLVGAAKWGRIGEALVDPHLPVRDVDHIKVINGRTGAAESELAFANFHRVLRSRLRALLAEDVDVSFGRALARVEYAADGRSVTAHFADGAVERGRLLVGADGSQSAVRAALLGPGPAALKRLQFAATFVTASFAREQARFLRAYHPLLSVVLHPDDMVGMLAILDAAAGDDKPEAWRFSFYISWRSSPEEQAAEVAAGMGARDRLRQLKVLSAQFADPLRSCCDWVPDDLEEVYWGGVANWDPSLPEHEWDNHGGLVTLLGDAAHPMTYHRGQGLNHAIADAAKLVEQLLEKDRPQRERIDAYEREMRARGGEEVRLSEMNSFMLHDWSRVAQSPLMKRGLSRGGGSGNGGGGGGNTAAAAESDGGGAAAG